MEKSYRNGGQGPAAGGQKGWRPCNRSGPFEQYNIAQPTKKGNIPHPEETPKRKPASRGIARVGITPCIDYDSATRVGKNRKGNAAGARAHLQQGKLAAISCL